MTANARFMARYLAEKPRYCHAEWRSAAIMVGFGVVAIVMAGLVPAIHVLFSRSMARGYIYILSNRRNGTLYVGVTNNLVRRVHEHREGVVRGFSKTHGLKILVYYEPYDDIRLAIQRERTMKHWPRAWKVRLIHGFNPDWNDLSLTLT